MQSVIGEGFRIVRKALIFTIGGINVKFLFDEFLYAVDIVFVVRNDPKPSDVGKVVERKVLVCFGGVGVLASDFSFVFDTRSDGLKWDFGVVETFLKMRFCFLAEVLEGGAAFVQILEDIFNGGARFLGLPVVHGCLRYAATASSLRFRTNPTPKSGISLGLPRAMA